MSWLSVLVSACHGVVQSCSGNKTRKTKRNTKMTQEEKIETLAEIFDCDAGELNPDVQLDTLEWDSMAMLSVIAMVKSKFDKKLPGSEIRAFKSIQDILNIME